ncbi:RNA polymerase sigma factor [Microbulbifer spongiae]|uniref:RNA polymerase sigma factor n=1 Tax=Microbulbifer spongiae TaxID=2944933 RepID=A0ABY9EGK6_9GAMM|nr:RNA polymerase sigma factor [Microbulbifer sp. MI-G]WKD51243.1 RNA polymerase sigma factor [Microbulbifer sp. MI-G]
MSEKDTISGIYIALRATLARAVSRIVPPKEIEDIVQETYVRVCQVKQKSEILYPRSFLLKTAQNLALDYLKRSETRMTVSADEDLEPAYSQAEYFSDETYDRVAVDEEFAHFCEAVRQLPVRCRRVFVLKKVYGYSQREIAKALNVSESTVEKHVATGIKRCTYFMMQRSSLETANVSLEPNNNGRTKQPPQASTSPSVSGQGGRT